jgi:predicted small lipoprotein YifL
MNRRVFARFLLACCLLLTLSACGNKGPLYLPAEEEVEKKESENDNQNETE